MDHPEGAGETGDGRLGFDRRVRLEFRGTQLSSDGGLLVLREPDDALGLWGLVSAALCGNRLGQEHRPPARRAVPAVGLWAAGGLRGRQRCGPSRP